ncbi:hypothetical protein MKK55_15240 [Methylobacterium sp. J-059]|uniref:hypothetical protein n=1 Tax=Methylobacterium sp. J-059 TaxID=2836643 RepID=UPI001FBA4FF1|nr:hypothetical protein [Methylobacterium sp. J-059]MCJ2040286.1 hypothetical protein [Methylobacterium sp. J-059]
MPLKSGRFTRQEQAFVDQMAHVNNPTLAARGAGYSQPASQGGVLMRRPDVLASVQAAVAYRLKTEGAEVGVGTLIEIAKDVKHPAASRVMAAKALVQLSGVAQGEDDGEKPLSSLSRAELAHRANQAREILAELDAPVIEHEAPAGTVFD